MRREFLIHLQFVSESGHLYERRAHVEFPSLLQELYIEVQQLSTGFTVALESSDYNEGKPNVLGCRHSQIFLRLVVLYFHYIFEVTCGGPHKQPASSAASMMSQW